MTIALANASIILLAIAGAAIVTLRGGLEFLYGPHRSVVRAVVCFVLVVCLITLFAGVAAIAVVALR